MNNLASNQGEMQDSEYGEHLNIVDAILIQETKKIT